MKTKRIMGLFLALVMSIGCMSLHPIVSYANDANEKTFNINAGSVNITQSGIYTITGTGQPTSNTISVTGSNITATITLNNVNIDVSEEFWASAFNAKGYGQSNVHLTIILQGTNSLASGPNCAGLIWGNSDNSSMLEIKGDGSLTATSGIHGAGIGGGFQGSGKNITITGGSVKANSISTTPTDGSGNRVYLVKLENQDSVNEVTVDSSTGNAKTFTRAGSHPDGDTAFYLYLTGKDHNLVTSKGKYKAKWNGDTNTYTIIEFGPEHGDVHIDADNFPNEHFRSYVKQFDGDRDGWLSKDELDKVTDISIENDQLVSDLKGIEWFKNLKELRCTNNKLTSLDVSKNTKLEQLWCAGNELTSLNVSKNTMLTELHCDRNKLKELDVRENKKLNGLDCSGNELTSLDVSKNKNLTGLWCSSNNLTILDLSENTELDQLMCSNNNLTSLDLSKNTKLNQVYCDGQQYNITVIKGERKFRYSDFPGQFKREKVNPYYWGAFFGGDALIVNGDNASEVGYKYVACDDNDMYIEMNVKLNVTFIEFDPTHVVSMKVTKQPKLSYKEGDPLDLTGIVVTLTDNQGLKRDVKFEEFGKYKIKAAPENDTLSTVAYHNEKTVKLTKEGLQATAETEKLTVKPRVFDPHNVKTMTVASQPTRLSYTAGDKLDLTGLVVTLKDDHNLTKDVTPAEFGTYGINANPENGTPLTVANHNDKAVKLTKDGVQAVETDKLKVKVRVFDKNDVTSLKVTSQPTNLKYTAGDKLDLSGLVVTLTDSHNLKQDVPLADFEANGIKANPENGTELTVADHNDKAVKLTKDGVSAVETEKLTVNAISASADAEDLAAAEAAHATVAMYRLYNTWTHEHLFTTDKAEYDNLVAAGWTGEGEIDSVAAKQGKGVYRLYNPYTHEHHYTSKEDEVADCVKAGWVNEGIKFHSVQNGTVPVYSMYNPNEQKFYHHYTSDPDEIAKMVKDGWIKEEIKWYAAPKK